jgi:hypothetical protein
MSPARAPDAAMHRSVLSLNFPLPLVMSRPLELVASWMLFASGWLQLGCYISHRALWPHSSSSCGLWLRRPLPRRSSLVALSACRPSVRVAAPLAHVRHQARNANVAAIMYDAAMA